MSAYVVDDITINRIVNKLKEMERDSRTDYVARPLKEIGYVTIDSKLGKDMMTLNCHSVDERYGKSSHKEFRDPAYSYGFARCSDVQAYKSLRCFLYQACEGDSDKKPLFVALSKVADNLAYHIVTSSKEYNAAEWG